MLELIRRKSAAGEAPSPSDLESTAATATAAASTPRGGRCALGWWAWLGGGWFAHVAPRWLQATVQAGCGCRTNAALPAAPHQCTVAGPLSEAAPEEVHAARAPSRSATPPLLRPGYGSGGDARVGRARAGQQQQGQQQRPQQQAGGEEDEGDNRSFYGSDSQVGIAG